MIINFKDKETKKLWDTGISKKIPIEIQQRALDKLDTLFAATALSDLKSPPSNQLESLQGDRKGQYSIRINNQWRLCFKWQDGNAFDVEIVDYH
jgi:proteic killer suppression protein